MSDRFRSALQAVLFRSGPAFANTSLAANESFARDESKRCSVGQRTPALEGSAKMHSAPFRWGSLAPKSSFMPLGSHPLPRRPTARLRRKRPSWAGLALLVVVVDFLLASLVW